MKNAPFDAEFNSAFKEYKWDGEYRTRSNSLLDLLVE
jgi:hypothetical protein